MNTSTLFSSASVEWSTPQGFYDLLDAEFHFNLDPCATPDNAKCQHYFTIDDDGLAQSWRGCRVFCNPPYGQPEYPCKPNCQKGRCKQRGYHIDKYIPGVGDWVKKAYEESQKGCLVCCLLPARTDTKYFHKYCLKGEIRFVQGRLKFGGSANSAPFPSMVVIFKGERP